MQIWKFEVPPGNGFIDFQLPKGAMPLSVQYQDKAFSGCLWVLVEPTHVSVKHRFHVIGTGMPATAMIEAMQFMGTWQLPDGTTWHLFDAGENDE